MLFSTSIKTTGLPDDINWTASAFDSNKNLIFVGNTVTASGNANLLITKYQPDGSIAWQRVAGGSAGLNDYGVAITIDNQNNSYVAAAMTAANGLFDFAVLKYDADGILQWTATWDGANHLHDIPTAITLDDAENIIVTGGTTSFTQQLNYAVVKFNSAGTRLWATTYDHANLYDFPTAIQKATNDNIVVTGASANAPNSWDYATILVNGATGQIENVNRVNVPEMGLDQPLAVARDNQNNLFITGYNEKQGNKNIQTVKLNSNFGLEWVKSYDAGGLEDIAKSIGCDAFGNVYIAGHCKTVQEGNTFVVLKYDTQGNLLWNQTYKPYTHDNARAADIKVMPTGDFYLSGTIQKGSETDFATLKYNKDGEIEWEKRFDGTGTDEVTTIKADNNGNIYVSGISESNHLKTYTTVKYQSIEVPNYLIRDASGSPKYSANRIIVKFDPEFVKKEAIDEANLEKEIRVAVPEHFLTPSAAQLLRNTISTDGEIYLERIFQRLKTTDTLTISRMNEPLIIPPFWSAFAVVVTDSIPTLALIDTLNTKKQIIEYAHPDFFIQLHSTPNDINYSQQQSSIHPTVNYSCSNPNICPSINVEQAWVYETGKPFVKVGIFDIGVDANLNPDFQWDACHNVVQGFDYVNNQNEVRPDWNDGHGTSIAGIIGAIRNNEKGIAGMAGGDHRFRPCPLPIGTPGDATKEGVSLYSMSILAGASALARPFSTVCQAIFDASINDRFGLHIMNHSWGIEYGSSEDNQKISLLSDCIHFANRAKVTIVVSRGNDATNTPSFPASFDDNWVLTVGGTGINGNYWSESTTEGGNFGNLDVSAPAAKQLIYTTNARRTNSRGVDPFTPNDYRNVGGTSMSAAHVSGSAALLLSHLNRPEPSFVNLAPEDVEAVLEQSATFINFQRFNEKTGYGRVNAGNAILHVHKSSRKLHHFSSETNPTTKTVTRESRNTHIKLREDYTNYTNLSNPNSRANIVIPSGDYTATVYRVEAIVRHNLIAPDNVFSNWERHSSSNTLPPISSDGSLLPHEKVKIEQNGKKSIPRHKR